MMGILIRYCKYSDFSDSFQIVVQKMIVIFCIIPSFFLAYARALQGFCTFCFHNLHRIGSKSLATSDIRVFFSGR